jgi:hypothetical protein
MTTTNATFVRTMGNIEARSEMLRAITKAEAAGIAPDRLDLMRLACEWMTNPGFKAAMTDYVDDRVAAINRP